MKISTSEFFSGRFSYDGHGINRNGRRVATLNLPLYFPHPRPSKSGYPVLNADRDALGVLFAAAPKLLETLTNIVKCWEEEREPSADTWQEAQDLKDTLAYIMANDFYRPELDPQHDFYKGD